MLHNHTPRQSPLTVREDGIALVTLDHDGAGENGLTLTTLAALERGLERAVDDRRVLGVVIHSETRGSFATGMGLEFLRSLRFASEAEAVALRFAGCFARISNAKKPIVACVNGHALGTGFELALACTAILATDNAETLVGLTDRALGLIPAAHGSVRVAKRCGLRTALDLVVSGRAVSAQVALSLGLVDEVVKGPSEVVAACRFAHRLATSPDVAASLTRKRSNRRAPDLKTRARAALDRTRLGRAFLLKQAHDRELATLAGAGPGGPAAAMRALEVLTTFAIFGPRRAAALEPRLFGELVVSEASRRLVELAIATFESQHELRRYDDELAAPGTIAVVGAGLMGAGISCASVAAGFPVWLKETNADALRRGITYVHDVLDEQNREGRLPQERRDLANRGLTGGSDFPANLRAALVIEAVPESLALKQAMLRDAEARFDESCIHASSTATLPLARIAEASLRPEHLVGMHYLSPVEKSALLEIVKTPETMDRAIATAVAVGRRQGKTMIIVRDSAGAYVRRILTPYFNEAVAMVGEGIPVERIDQSLLVWGFAEGPLRHLDEIGIDFAAFVATALSRVHGARLAPSDALSTLARDHRCGRKNARGFYRYGAMESRRASKTVDATVYETLRAPQHALVMPEEPSLRCALAFINEAVRCLEDGVLCSARDGDVGAVYGCGFPGFRGGPFRYIDAVGANEIVRRTRALEQRFGARFTPAPRLVEMARSGKRFYEPFVHGDRTAEHGLPA